MHAADAFSASAQDAVSHPAPDPVAAQLQVLAERLSRTLAVARALALAGRHVELAGIQDGVGLLCAKTLDLDRPHARGLLPALHELTAQIDSLYLILHPAT
jgi:hypothetical protein